MSYNDEKRKGLRVFGQIFNLLLDVNDGDFSDDDNSYNTPRTTLDPAAFLKGNVLSYPYSKSRLGFTNLFPKMVSMSISPAVLKIGEDVALSASATVTINDFESNDTFELPEAFADRRVIASHFGKLFDRNFIINRDVELLQGYDFEAFDPTNFENSKFVVKSYSYPDQSGLVKFDLIDRLFFSSASKDKCPATSNVLLDGAITAGSNSLDFTGSTFGDRGRDVEIALNQTGTINIDNELMNYLVTDYDGVAETGSLSISNRGLSGGGPAEDHEDVVTIQGCKVWLQENVTDIIRTIFNDFSNIGDGFIDDAAYDALKNGDLGPFDLTNIVVEPLEIKTLLKQLMESTGAWLYFDVIDNLIVLGYTGRFTEPVITLNEQEHILRDSLTIKILTDKQVTRAKIAFNKRDYTEGNDLRQYKNTFENRDDINENDAHFGQVYEPKTIFSNWYTGTLQDQLNANNIVTLKVLRFTDPPFLFTFKLDSHYVGDLLNGERLWYGSVINLITKRLINVDGTLKQSTCQVISIKPDTENDSFTLQAISYVGAVIADVDLFVNSDRAHLNLANEIQPVEVKEYVVVIGNVQIYGTTFGGNTPALEQGVFPVGSTLKIINQGIITGYGGDAGDGAIWDSSMDAVTRLASDGDNGGLAMTFTTDVIIDNSTGQIQGGGGGSAGGGATQSLLGDSGGGGGGGGAGRVLSSGGLGYPVFQFPEIVNGKDGTIELGGNGGFGFFGGGGTTGVAGGMGGEGGADASQPPPPVDDGNGTTPSGVSGNGGDCIHLNGNSITWENGFEINIKGDVVP